MPRVYRSQPELRELMLEHGLAVCVADGLADGPPNLAAVFRHIEEAGLPAVTKGSVLGPSRLWPSQRDYQVEVKVHCIRTWAATSFSDPRVEEAVRAGLAAADTSSLATRAVAVSEYVRTVAQVFFDTTHADPLWRILVAIWGQVASTPGSDADHRLAAALRDARRTATQAIRDGALTPVVAALGLRPNVPGLSVAEASDLCADLAVAVGQGWSFELEFTENGPWIERSDPGGGPPRSWSLYAMAIEAILRQFFELDPDWKPRRSPAQPAAP